MTEVLAVSPTPDQATLDGLARDLADVYAGRVSHCDSGPPGATGTAKAERVLARADRAAVGAVVLDVDPAPRTAFWTIIRRASKPVVAIPPGVVVDQPLRTVLVPLDGREESSLAVAPVAARLLAAGLVLGAVHVLEASTMPEFCDQAAHDPPAWSSEFLRRHLPDGVHLDVRSGRPAEEVLDEASRSGADLILLAWSQSLADERARVVRKALSGPLPVMLVGTGFGAGNGAGSDT
jgi:nucleotide-binding universal stress UspA family protein